MGAMIKTIAVTGGAGFLGSHLCARLCRERHRVLCIDNFCTGKLENIAPLLEQPNFRLIRADILELPDLGEPIDEIYHLACPASPYFYQQDPVATIKTNVIGTLRMLELAKLHNATLLQASTSEVYGDPLEHPQTESYSGNVSPIGIRACYDEGKRAAETLCFDFQRQYGTRIKVVRIFNTYGPDMHAQDGRVIPNFILQALAGRPLTIYGDGSQTRSFCYVEDMVDALVAMMQSDPGFWGPVNLGNPCECSMLELADRIIAMTGSASEKVFLPLPKDDPRKRKPSIELARQKLGWTPETDFEQGLRTTVESFQKPVLSIIVPIYNAQAYLEPCVDSILNQSFQSLELLLIDDGSTDQSGALCDAYAAKDPRVRVFHKENGGVSSARALGLAHARGEYVGFADSDDLVAKSMYGRLMELLQKTGSEIACCDNHNFYEGENFSLDDAAEQDPK
jgi:UDP-glucuronate decarboxylase